MNKNFRYFFRSLKKTHNLRWTKITEYLFHYERLIIVFGKRMKIFLPDCWLGWQHSQSITCRGAAKMEEKLWNYLPGGKYWQPEPRAHTLRSKAQHEEEEVRSKQRQENMKRSHQYKKAMREKAAKEKDKLSRLHLITSSDELMDALAEIDACKASSVSTKKLCTYTNSNQYGRRF